MREVAAIATLTVMDALRRSLSSSTQEPHEGLNDQEANESILRSLQQKVLWGQTFDPACNVRIALAEGGALAHELNSLHFTKIGSEADQKAEAEAAKMRMSKAWQDNELAVKEEVTIQLEALEKLRNDVEAETDAMQKHLLLVENRQALVALRQVSSNVKGVATLAGVVVGFFTAIDTKLDVIGH